MGQYLYLKKIKILTWNTKSWFLENYHDPKSHVQTLI